MSKVNILPPDVIAKIAAGEAVDRPASVIKELLENSIDAGATSIEISLKDAGKELIHIRDNGSGMSKEDLEKIFQRHATSKITSIDDLEKLHSMGFRGEALYSIAAVSDVTLTSKASNDDGWQMHLRGGVRQHFEPASLSHTGTDIKIAELFFNTPARRKFLKNNATELNQILNVVLSLALIYPQKRFTLNHAGRSLLDLKPAPTDLDRVAAALNLKMNLFLQASQDFTEDQIHIKMILGNINVQRPRRDLQYIFVNHRPVESKNISFNMNDVYKLIMPPGIYGAFIIDLSLNPANVDVNIHPTKREVRIKNEARLISLLRRMVEHTLMSQGQAKELLSPFVVSPPLVGGVREGGMLPLMNAAVRSASKEIGPFDTDTINNTGNAFNTLPLDFQLFDTDNTLHSKFTRARFVGSFLQKFLLFEAGQSLLIVDQHAAQERIMFEKFKNQIDNAKVETQPLLSPLLLKLTPQEKISWEELQEELNNAGIETNQFDDDTIAIQTQPLLLNNIEAVVRDLLAGGESKRIDRDTLARRACKASIVAGDKLDIAQANFQRQQLLGCQDPFTCPHGRPTLIEVTQDFLDRQFLRT